jgi:hypothetical protein
MGLYPYLSLTLGVRIVGEVIREVRGGKRC